MPINNKWLSKARAEGARRGLEERLIELQEENRRLMCITVGHLEAQGDEYVLVMRGDHITQDIVENISAYLDQARGYHSPLIGVDTAGGTTLGYEEKAHIAKELGLVLKEDHA